MRRMLAILGALAVMGGMVCSSAWVMARYREAHHRRAVRDLLDYYLVTYCRDVGQMPSSWDDLRRQFPQAMDVIDDAAIVLDVQWPTLAAMDCDVDPSQLQAVATYRTAVDG